MITLEGLEIEQVQYRATLIHQELRKDGKPNSKAGQAYHLFNLANGTKFNSDSQAFLDAYNDGSLFTLTLKPTAEGLAEVSVWKTRKQIEALYSNEEYKRKVRKPAAETVTVPLNTLVAGS